MEVILFLLILGLAIHALRLRSQVEELSERVQALEYPAHAVTPVVEPVYIPVPPPLPRAEAMPAQRQTRVPEPAFVESAPASEPMPEGPTLTDRMRALVGGDEWESLIGGSILNKLGALVLVIGIALFLGFSFARITAAGRAAMALTVSLAILGAGVWVERRERYRLFARGLIGAGWAALYATAYAIYAIPEARIIDNVFAGSVILLTVGAGMILHSLRYRAQAVTAVAYFSAFAALAVSPSSPFAVVSLIPLAASVLYLAARFNWYPMALFGLIATYATCISRGSSNAPLAEVQALFLAYWILFDLFDLLRVKRRIVAGGVEWIYYGNLAGFTVLSYLAWARHQPTRLWFAAASGSALFLADAIARAILRPPSSFDDAGAVGERLEGGSFEVSALVSAVLAGASLVANVAGVWLSAGLALEAETLYLLGVRFASPFLRYLGMVAFGHSLLRLGLTPYGRTWTPPALFHAVLFYVNRVIRRPNISMSTAAAVMVALAVGIETPVAYLGSAWIACALALFEIGLRTGAIDFRMQAYALGSAGAAASLLRGDTAGCAISLALVFGCAVRSRWIELEERVSLAVAVSGIAMALAFVLLWHTVPIEYLALSWFGLALIALELGNAKLPEEMRWCIAPAGLIAFTGITATHRADFIKFPGQPAWVSFFGCGLIAAVIAIRARKNEAIRQGFTAAATLLLVAGAWLVTPDHYVTLAWTAIALTVLELGFREIAAGAFALVYFRMADFDLGHAPVVSMPLAIIAIYRLWYRVRDLGATARFIFWIAPIPLLALLYRNPGPADAAAAFMIVALMMLSAGIHFRLRDARLQSYIVGGIVFILGALPWPGEVLISAETVALLYAAQALAKRSEETRAAPWFSAAATILLTELLYIHISGGMLTVACGFEGLALLACGFLLRERILRLEGLSLLLACILKLFLYDLRNLETFPRILSFVALGAIMLGVSWIYTRFRNNLRDLL